MYAYSLRPKGANLLIKFDGTKATNPVAPSTITTTTSSSKLSHSIAGIF